MAESLNTSLLWSLSQTEKETLIQSRHSIRHYLQQPLSQSVIDTLQAEIDLCNQEGNLHIQLILNEPQAFSGLKAYGSFSGVENYLVMTGDASSKDFHRTYLKSLNERIGYYGEQLVLVAQKLGLGTCWAGISYRKVKETFTLSANEKVLCMIALGYPADNGKNMRKKAPEQISNTSNITPNWFNQGIAMARLAPSAINQQKYSFEYIDENIVKAHKGFSFIGYTQMDLGIAKLHFELGANHPVDWKQAR